MIEIARNCFVMSPTGNAKVDGELAAFQQACFVEVNSHFNRTIPGIPRLLLQLDRATVVQLDVSGAAGVKIDVEGIALLSINVTGNRSEKPRDIARAAGDTKPLAALISTVRLKRVRVEEMGAIER